MLGVTVLKYLLTSAKRIFDKNVNRKRAEVRNKECSTRELLLPSAPNLTAVVNSLEVNRERRHCFVVQQHLDSQGHRIIGASRSRTHHTR
jgi:hypothetical protein